MSSVGRKREMVKQVLYCSTVDCGWLAILCWSNACFYGPINGRFILSFLQHVQRSSDAIVVAAAIIIAMELRPLTGGGVVVAMGRVHFGH